ncbi:DUF4166 domain-containing protein [Haloarcula montana]|uniref:DUF4166 domain-containing protein n=1 Tax=Haloarcula montana TaxID=3111776 RepID=UPI002D7A17D3|nr:DUF4166 domain-containing protein [Haloarcula sp. GH36]
MTGVYERALGEAAADLHPKVRERYSVGIDDDACIGRGWMEISRALHMVPVLYGMTVDDLLFPEQGSDVPFTVTTVGFRTDGGHEAMTTRRTFSFDGTTRHFDSLTVWDDEHGRLLDFLGGHGLVASELRPRVEDGTLVVEGGRQWARLGSTYVPLPGPLAASVEVRDRYDESDGRFHIDAVVENALAGRILSYRGSFTQTVEARETVPETLRRHGLTTLPPR